MRNYFLPFLLLLSAGVFGQTTVSGVVTDKKNRQVTGASLAIKDSYDGAVTDSSGHYKFTTFEKGSQFLVVTAIGYLKEEQAVHLAGGRLTVNVQLKEEVTEMKAVVITAGTFEASDKKRTTVLNSIDIVTTASANADVTGALKTLPGAQQVGESEGLFVRGGTAGETRTYIDGTLVNNFFYTSVPNIAQRGRFSPFIFKGTVFSAGGYSALYGQALSSALILESIDLPEQSSASLSISPLGGGAGFQKLNKNKTASWGVNYGYTFLNLAYKVLENNVDYTRLPSFHTGDANFRVKTRGSGMLKYYGYFSQNSLSLRKPSLDTPGHKESFALGNFNIYQNLSWRENIGAHWKVNAGLSYTNNKDNIDGALLDGNNQTEQLAGFEYKNFGLRSRGNFLNGKLVFDRRLRGLSALRAGAEYNYSNDKAHYTMYNGDTWPNFVIDNITAVFAEGDIYLTNNMAVRAGSRLEHSSLIGKTNLAPRLSLSYKTGEESQASLAYGIFYQNPDRRYLPAAVDVGFQKATHYIAQYQKVSNLQTFRLEAFYKIYDHLEKTAFVQSREVAASSNGSGYARGIELFWRDKKSFKNFDYWVSYSFLDTKRDFLTFPYEMAPNFAAKHTANLVLKKFVTSLKTQFNANYQFATGRPYYNIRFDGNANEYKVFDSGTTPNYNSLSLSVNYLPNLFKQSASRYTVFVLSITNALGTHQVFGYNYSYNGVRKEAIVPPTKTFVYLGAFFSFGVDRSQEVINSNL